MYKCAFYYCLKLILHDAVLSTKELEDDCFLHSYEFRFHIVFSLFSYRMTRVKFGQPGRIVLIATLSLSTTFMAEC